MATLASPPQPHPGPGDRVRVDEHHPAEFQRPLNSEQVRSRGRRDAVGALGPLHRRITDARLLRELRRRPAEQRPAGAYLRAPARSNSYNFGDLAEKVRCAVFR